MISLPIFLLTFGANLASICIAYQVGKLHSKTEIVKWLHCQIISAKSKDVVDFINAMLDDLL